MVRWPRKYHTVPNSARKKLHIRDHIIWWRRNSVVACTQRLDSSHSPWCHCHLAGSWNHLSVSRTLCRTNNYYWCATSSIMDYYCLFKKESFQSNVTDLLSKLYIWLFKLKKKLFAGSWFKGDVKAVIDDALATGGGPAISNSLTINGQPGDLYPCSEGKPCMPTIWIIWR